MKNRREMMPEATLLSKQEEKELNAQLKELDLRSCCSTIRRWKADFMSTDAGQVLI